MLVERLDASKSGSQTVFSKENVERALKECPSLRSQQKSLGLLLDSDDEMAKYLILSRALMSEKYDNLSQQFSVLQVKHEGLIERYKDHEPGLFVCDFLIGFNSLEMMVKDDYESFCNVDDRAASVRFQEMHLFFPKTPEPLSEGYFVTIQVRCTSGLAVNYAR